MTGKKARKRENDRERERFGERGRPTQRMENGVVDFDRLSKSNNTCKFSTPEIFLKVSINNNNRRIRHHSSFGWHSTFLG
jgi:hypothetical protein